MKKIISLVLLFAMTITLCACTSQPAATQDNETKPDASVDPVENSDENVSGSEMNFEDEGYKIAYILNAATTEIFEMAFESAKTEGKKLGITVDCYSSDGDDLKYQDMVSQCVELGYDGLLLSHLKSEYAYDLVMGLLEKGIEVTVNDCVFIGPDGAECNIEGVTRMTQDDWAMTHDSLDYMVNMVLADKERPLKVIKLWTGPGIVSMDQRQEEYKLWEEQGLIETLEIIGPTDPTNREGSVCANLSAVLAKYPEGSVDFIWSAYDAYARGALQALLDAGRTDIPIVTIDVSNQDLNYMLEYPDIWRGCCCTHYATVGEQGVRITAMRLHGDDDQLEEFYMLKPSLLTSEQIKTGMNVLNLNEHIEGYGVNDDHLTDWMKEVQKRLGY